MTSKRNVRPFNVDSDGFIRDELLHDAEIMAVRVENDSSERRLILDLKSESGVELRITLEGAEIFVCDSFFHQNVVMEVQCQTDNASIDDVRKLGKRLGVDDAGISRYMSKLKSHHLKYVEFVPSLGCEVAAICREVEIAEVV